MLETAPGLGGSFAQAELLLHLDDGVEGMAGGHTETLECLLFFICRARPALLQGPLDHQHELVGDLGLDRHDPLPMLLLGAVVLALVELLNQVVPADRHDQQQAVLVGEPGAKVLLQEDLEQRELTRAGLLGDVAEDDGLLRTLDGVLGQVDPERRAELRRQHLGEDLAAGLDALLELLGLGLAVLVLHADLLRRNAHSDFPSLSNLRVLNFFVSSKTKT